MSRGAVALVGFGNLEVVGCGHLFPEKEEGAEPPPHGVGEITTVGSEYPILPDSSVQCL